MIKINLFSKLYEKTLKWAEHKFAPRYLALLSFAESVFFPIPPDVLLAPMVLSKPDKAWTFAGITTLFSVLGGMVGYTLGYFMFEPWIQPLFIEMGYQATLDKTMTWFSEYGLWVIFLAGFSPIPYKIFTVSAGFLQMAFIPFLLASVIGRGMRFYILAGLIKWGGKSVEKKLKKWIDILGSIIVTLIIISYLIFK
jgi:membrane protein YqaA with SNARE-associated domain